MNKLVSLVLNFLKYILFLISFVFILYGILITFKRLDKNFNEAIGIMIPFVFVLIVFFISLITRSKTVKENILFNFVCVISFISIILIFIRARFDSNMILFYKYDISFNPTFFTDNLIWIQIILYMIGIANIILLVINKRSLTLNNKIIKDLEIKNDVEEIL